MAEPGRVDRSAFSVASSFEEADAADRGVLVGRRRPRSVSRRLSTSERSTMETQLPPDFSALAAPA